MIDSVGNCIAAYLEEFLGVSSPVTWVVLVPEGILQDAHKSTAVLMPQDATCSGRAWLFSDGSKFIVASFNEEPCPDTSNVLICSDGRPFKTNDLDRLKAWRNKK